MKHRYSLTRPALIGAALLAITLAFTPHATLNAQPFNGDAEFVPDEIIVQFKTTASAQHLADALQRAALTVKNHLPARGQRAGESGLVVLNTTLPVTRAIAALQNHPAVDYAQPNFVYRHHAVSNDPQYTRGKLWGMYGDAFSPVNQFGSQANEAWANNHLGSPDVYVGVIDEGIDISHPDLAANIGRNPGETGLDAYGNDKATNGLDDDDNGYVNDVYGWDFWHGDNTIYDGGDKDRCKDDHGTHVSGTIGAKGGNGIGVAGVCWNVKILNAKFLGPDYGTSEGAIGAVEYMTALKLAGVNIVAVNNSWGGGPYEAPLHAAIIRAAKAGILFVAAAGNNGFGSPSYPARYTTLTDAKLPDGTIVETAASYDAVIAVAAIDSKGALASFSNYSSTYVDLGAPGVNVMSTLPGGRYGAWNGTSMATPHVTGGCALYLSSYLDAFPWEIKTAILGNTIPTSSLSGKTVTGGRLNVSGF